MRKTVLSIDNDESILEIVKITLEVTVGWQVLIAQGGEEGLVVAKTEQPDMILLDLLMPGMNGEQTLEELRANPVTQEIPIMLFTCRPDLAGHLLQAEGVYGIINKPFDILTLPDQISQALTW